MLSHGQILLGLYIFSYWLAGWIEHICIVEGYEDLLARVGSKYQKMVHIVVCQRVNVDLLTCGTVHMCMLRVEYNALV